MVLRSQSLFFLLSVSCLTCPFRLISLKPHDIILFSPNYLWHSFQHLCYLYRLVQVTYKYFPCLIPDIFSQYSLWFSLINCLIWYRTNNFCTLKAGSEPMYVDQYKINLLLSARTSTSLKITFGSVSALSAPWLLVSMLIRSYLWGLKLMFLAHWKIAYTSKNSNFCRLSIFHLWPVYVPGILT